MRLPCFRTNSEPINAFGVAQFSMRILLKNNRGYIFYVEIGVKSPKSHSFNFASLLGNAGQPNPKAIGN